MIRVALAGYGYWGRNLARVIHEHPELDLWVIADPDLDRLEEARHRYPEATLSRIPEILGSAVTDAVVIATPVSSHAELVRSALEAGKHVLVTKPLTDSSEAAEALLRLAREWTPRRVLQVDHTFIYSGAVRELAAWNQKADGIGDWLYFDSTRINLGTFRDDADVLWDLAAHDLSILLYLLAAQDLKPTAVQAIGADPTATGKTSVAHLTVWLNDVIPAAIHVSWLSPVKVRRLLLAGNNRMAVYDDTEPSEKVRIYDSGADTLTNGRIDYRTGDCIIPKLSFAEPLAVEVDHWYASITEGAAVLSDGLMGLEVIRILEAATRSLNRDGERVELDS